MDKRLKLTDKQRKAIEKYNAAVKELDEANVWCVFSPFETILAFNGKHCCATMFPEDIEHEENCAIVDFGDTTQIACPFGLNLAFDDGSFGVQFKP